MIKGQLSRQEFMQVVVQVVVRIAKAFNCNVQVAEVANKVRCQSPLQGILNIVIRATRREVPCEQMFQRVYII
jgi:hypothetical protein